jgi:hypothetical protein
MARRVILSSLALTLTPAAVVVTTLTLLAAACTSGAPPRAHGETEHPPSPTASRTAGLGETPSPGTRQGSVVPATYQQACVHEESVCLPGTTGSIPVVLNRALHFPVLRPGQRCPATHGRPVNNSYFGGIALGNGAVRPLIAMKGDLRHGVVVLAKSSRRGWLAFKTLWFSVPGYHGPFLISAERLDRPGPVAFGESPTLAPLVVPPGQTLNTGAGYRTAPGGTWVRAPGCYAWQVDGLTFSEVIVVRAVLPAGPSG